jgi:hypothetical protein
MLSKEAVLCRATDAGAQYKVPERLITAARSKLASIPQDTQLRVGVAALVEAVLTVAETHRGECAVPCAVCDALRDAVAVILVLLRAEVPIDAGPRPPE